MTVRIVRLSLWAALLCGLAAAAGHAQSAKLGRIRVSGTTRFPEAVVVQASGLEPGRPVTREEIQAAADRLAQLGPFQNVRYRFTTRGEEVELEFQLEDSPAIPVSFDNFATFDDSELVAALKQAVPLFDGTAPEQGTMLDAMTAALQALLEKRGIKASVERTPMLGAGDEGMILQFKINAPAMKVKAVEFGHALAAESPRMAEAVRVLIGKPFSRFAASVFLYEHARPLYHRNGHLEVQFGAPQVRFTGNPNQPLPDEVTLFLPIEPGPVYRMGEITWSGELAFDVAALNGMIGVAPGAVADGLKIEGGWDRVKREYGRKGFLDASIEVQPKLDRTAHVVSYQARITQGPQYRMGQMVITGLSVTAERMLRAAWKLPAGAVFDLVYFEDFLERQCRQKGAFGEAVVTYNEVGHLLRTQPEARIVDVLLDFKTR
jgi:outer membrane protein insertion porin family